MDMPRTRGMSSMIVVLGALPAGAQAQPAGPETAPAPSTPGPRSFYAREAERMIIPMDENGRPDELAGLRGVSMLVVEPPEPRRFKVHDIVYVIIDETSKSQSKESLETEKKFDLSGEVTAFPSLQHLLEGQLENGDSSRDPSVDVSGKHKFEGEGDAERSDRFIARVAAEVIDVKPNGTLVLEAKKRIAQNQESKMIVLSGLCRQEDVTTSNTISSSQLAGLTITQTTDGELSKAGRKGLIPRVLEAVFNF